MVIAGMALVVGACNDDTIGGGGGGSDGGGFDGGGLDDDLDADDFGDALADALPGGGGGTLVFDGEEIPIDSAICVFGDDGTLDVGTVSDNGFRVFVSRNNPANDIGVQILDADFLQWFPDGVSGDEAERVGDKLVSSGLFPYFNNSDDRRIEARFTVECP